MATSISFSGVGSGIDFSRITDAVVAERMVPVAQLQSKSAEYGQRADALKQLNSLLVNLTQTAQALTDRTLGTGFDAVSSDATTVGATVTSGATVGTSKLQVTRLATSLVQASHSYTASTSAVLRGGVTVAKFELRQGGAASGTEITINSENNSLAGLRDAINAAHAGLTASIVDVTGKGSYQIVLSSAETGAAGRVELVETTNTGTLTDIGLRRLDSFADPSDFSGLDAELNINGLSVTRSSNSIGDAVAGLKLDLKKTGTVAITLKESADIGQKLQTFVNAYNAVQDYINTQYKKDGTGKPTGLLAGDPTLRSVQQQLRDAVGATSVDNGGALSNLAEIGIGRTVEGKLTLDKDKLDGQLTRARTDVRSLIYGLTGARRGIAQGIFDLSTNLSDNIGGTIQTAINGYQNSIKSLDKSVADKLASISSLRASLARQYATMDAAIGQLNGQGTALTNILKSMSPDGNR